MRGSDTRQPATGLELVLVMTCFSFLTGAIDAAISGTRIFVLHRFAWVSPDVAWMAPLAYWLFFSPLILLFIAVSRLIRISFPLAAAMGCGAGLAAFSLMLPFQQIYPWASILLSAGIGIQMGRVATRNPAMWRRRLVVVTLALAVLIIGTGGGIRIFRAWTTHRLIEQLPQAAAGSPNVLVIVMDTVRRSNLHFYGYERPTTPQLDRIVPESTVFDYAIAPAPWTLPSHASLFTGRPAMALTHSWNTPLAAGPRTLAEAMLSRGYSTGAFVANFLYTSYESGLARGFVRYDDYPVRLDTIIRHASLARSTVFQLTPRTPVPQVVRALLRFNRLSDPADTVRSADSVSDAFLAWQSRIGDRPFFAFLNYFDAHAPYRAPEAFLAPYRQSPGRDVDKYDGAITWLDSEIGRVLNSLRARGVLDNTIVVITSDHGEQFGGHGLRIHGNSLYLQLLRVPLLIRYPSRVPAGRRIDAVVTLHDVAATLLNLTGASGELPGKSLTRYWTVPPDPESSVVIADVDQTANTDPNVPNADGPMQALLDERLHYILDGRGQSELYAWREDPTELNNLAEDPAWKEELARMRNRLDAARAEARQQP